MAEKGRRITPRNLRLSNCSVDVALRRSGRQVVDVIDRRGDIKWPRPHKALR
ncbi:hypothetical protein HF228_25565 [Rhizobium leguminosarum]|nr:hypothetical protein [Rhizobium leguminosarum]